jgi:DNA-binding IclR family transcriptional regulator
MCAAGGHFLQRGNLQNILPQIAISGGACCRPEETRMPATADPSLAEPGAPGGTQLLDRAVAVLQHLATAGDGGERLTTIAEAVGLNISTAHRILGALERHGLVEREASTRRHRLGVALFALGARAADGTGLRRLCRPAMLRLVAATDEAVFLMVRSGLDAIVVDRQQGSYAIETLTENVGGAIPLGIGASSLAILASLPEAEAEAVLQANAARYTRYNETEANIRGMLGTVRQQGWIARQSSVIEGLLAIAVPIRPPGRDAVAALAVNMLTARLLPDRLDGFVTLLREEVGQIEAALAPRPERRAAVR